MVKFLPLSQPLLPDDGQDLPACGMTTCPIEKICAYGAPGMRNTHLPTLTAALRALGRRLVIGIEKVDEAA